MSPAFVHLRVHTEYSLVDGLIDVKALVKRAVALNQPALAVTDQGNLFALVKFYKAALSAGVKPIAGADVWLVNPQDAAAPFRLTLLAQNLTGYRHLAELLSRAYIDGQHQGVPMLRSEWLVEYGEGLIVLSGAREGQIGQALLNGRAAEAETLLNQWLERFPDRFFVELQRTGRPHEEAYIDAVVELAARCDAPVVATNDVRFLDSDDFDAHEARVCIHQGRVLEDPRRPRPYSEQQFLRSTEAMLALFADLPSALANTVEIAKRCNLELRLGKPVLPDFPVPEGMTPDDFFTQQARDGLTERLNLHPPKSGDVAPYWQRLEIELGVIKQMGFPGYFLIVADFIQWAKANDIPVGPGRGSGAGSLVAYALKITDLDPLEFDLLFERFLNPERVSMPDFDIDFCMERRDEVIDYVARKYGRERVSQIITYGSMAAKAVVRDVGRVLGHPYGFVDGLAKLIPFELGITLEKALKDSEDLRRRYDNEEDVHALIDLAMKLEGLARNAGKHAGGVVIAPSKLVDFSPLYCEAGGGNLVTQFDKDDVEAVGLVKFDFLGLRTLTIIDWALETVNRRLQSAGLETVNIDQIPRDDAASYALLKRCATTAVFQLESRGMKDLIRRLQPDCFEDIIALVALFRPGPLQSGMVDDFVARKHGRAKVDYPHPSLEEILKPTYGVIVYQEQVMQIAQVLAGYSLGGADLLRRCLSGSTQVMDVRSGDLISLAEIASQPQAWLGREIFSLNLNNLRIEARPITAIYPNGVRPTWTLRTRTGKAIRATADHLFYTVDGWQPLSAFKVGDTVALAANLPIQNQSNISTAQIKLIAYLLGDGHLSTKKPSNSYFCNTDVDVLEDFNQCAEALFGQRPPVDGQTHPGRKTVFYARIGCVSAFNQWVDQHVTRAHSHDKTIPAWVYRLSAIQLRQFIGTLWSTDGSFDRSIGHSDYTSTSEILIRQLQHLLLRLGVVALFNVKTITYKGQPHRSYRAQITGREDMLRFLDQIQPYLSTYKQQFAEECRVKLISKSYNQSKHQIPAAVAGLIAEAKRQSGLTWTEIDIAAATTRGAMSSGIRFEPPYRHALSRQRVQRFARVFADAKLYALANSEVLWDQIVSIDYYGEEPVFDLTIGHNHNLVANDFIAHNCMGKKKPEEMAQQREIFVSGAAKNKIDPDQANSIFDLMEKFAEYGFNKSHSAAYALVSYQTAWLKAHYPAEFMAAVMSSDMDNTDKVVVLIEECRQMRLAVLPPDINRSELRFTVQAPKQILFGLGAIKGVGESAINDLIQERNTHAYYNSLGDFCRRVDSRKANKRVLEALIKAGAFDSLDKNRARHLAELPTAMKVAEQHGRMDASGQNDLFGLDTASVGIQEPVLAETIEEWSEDIRLAEEKATIGLYLTGHPIARFEQELTHFVTARLNKLQERVPTPSNNGEGGGYVRNRANEIQATVAGLVMDMRTRQNKQGKRMAFLLLDDRTGRVEVAVFSETFEKFRDLLGRGGLLVVQGSLGIDDFSNQLRLTAETVMGIEEAREKFAKHLLLHWPTQLEGDETAAQCAQTVRAVLEAFRGGRCPVVIEYHNASAKALLRLSDDWRIVPSDSLRDRLAKRCNDLQSLWVY